jgi:5,10-methylenetetrahydromethanopterin reductase
MIGVMFERDRAPEELPGFARELEAEDVDQLWVVEDLGWGGAIAAAATALAATARITVGIGIVPARFRNAALLAMELATLERLYPGRLIAGIGHGVGPWMHQVGVAVASPLTALEETFVGVRALLSGDLVQMSGRYVTLDGIRLVHPPVTVTPLLAGVMNPKSLQLSGQVSDGTILPEGTGPESLSAALLQIRASRPHQLVVLTHLFIDGDPEKVRMVTAPIRTEFSAVHAISEQQVFLAAGTDSEAATAISSLRSAGADCVVLRPVGAEPMPMVRLALRALGRR